MKVVRVKVVHRWNLLVTVGGFLAGAIYGSWHEFFEPILQWFELLIKYGI